MPRPQHDLYQPEQVAELLGLPLKLVRGLQHGPYSFHNHFEFYQITLNNPGPWGDVQIIPVCVHDRITDESFSKIPGHRGAEIRTVIHHEGFFKIPDGHFPEKDKAEWVEPRDEVIITPAFETTHDPEKVQKLYDDVQANMGLVEFKIRPSIGEIYPEHNPECEDHSIERMPSGEWISPHTASGGLDRSKKRRLIPFPEVAWDHDWKMHVSLVHIEAEHHKPLIAAMEPHLPANHIVYVAVETPSA